MRSKILAPLLAAIAIVACSGTTTSPTGAPGTLTILLTDSPFSDARSLLVTFTEVSVHSSGGGWVTLPFADGGASRTCDLKKLTDAHDVLGTGQLDPGHYTMVRLEVSSAALYFDNAAEAPACAATVAAPEGRSAPVEVPSGTVRLNRQFEVSETGALSMLLDFDGDRSVKETGNGRYLMTPVIGIVSVE